MWKLLYNYYYYYEWSFLHLVRLAIQYVIANNFVFLFIYLGRSSGDENGARWVLFQYWRNIIFQWFAYQCFTDLFEREVLFNKVLQTLEKQQFLQLNSPSMDELGNWCHQRLVGPPWKYKAQQGGSMATRMSRNQPCKGPPTSLVTLKELQWWNKLPNPILTVARLLWQVGRARHQLGKIGDQSSDPSKAVICKDQQSRQLQIMLWHTWQGKPLWPPSRSRTVRRPLDALTQD